MAKTILITSGKGGVGKSTVCTMLGAALAIAGMLLVFLCLPVELMLIALGIALTVSGLLLLRC